jgi:Glycosyltransferase sugar-binding region containing DXD motif
MRIPSLYHLIRFSAKTELRTRPFGLVEYLAVRSCAEVNRPGMIRFYCDEEPWGAWWELGKSHLEVVRMRAPAATHGIVFKHPAHQTDVARLEILLEHGGIYLDLDVMCLRPFLPLQNGSVVMGEESGVGLCNAVILAEPDAPFLRRWLDAYAEFDADDWNLHSVREPARLAAGHPGEVTVLDERKFFWPMYWPGHLEAFFRKQGSGFCRESYCVHLWATLSQEYLDEITPRTIWERESEFCLLARRFVGRVRSS